MEFAKNLIEIIQRVTGALEKNGTGYCIAGGWAAGAWGIPRATEDIDILLLVDENERNGILELMGKSVSIMLSHKKVARFKGIAIWRNVVAIEGSEDHVIIDFILADTEYLRVVIERSVDLELHGFRMKMISAEDLIVLKLLSNRPQDRLDIEGILATGRTIDSEYIREKASGLGIDMDLTFLP